MTISTSINISVSRKKRLVSAARSLGTSVREVLSALMSRSRLHYGQLQAEVWKSVDYQPDAFVQEEDYTIMHVDLDALCYEFGVSERLLFKVSVSFIYRVMIDLFLDYLVENGLHSPVSTGDIATNYHDLKYGVSFSEAKSYEYWVIKWAKRTKKEKLKKDIVIDKEK